MKHHKRNTLRRRPGTLTKGLLDRYFAHDVARDSAALTYYLLFAIFPLLVFISTLVGLMHLDTAEIAGDLERVLPQQVTGIMESYLEYVSTSPSRQLLIFSLIFSVWFPMRSTSCLLHSMRKAYGVGQPASMMSGTLRNFFFTLWLIVAIAASLVLTTVGRKAMSFIGRFVTVPESFISVWGSLRFALLGIVMLLVLAPMHMAAVGKRVPLREVVPGVILSMAAWMALSAAFSYYVEKVAHYSELYGSIATIIVVLLWLYMTGQILVMGAEFNGARLESRRGNHLTESREGAGA